MSAKSLAKAAREALDREDYGTALRLTDLGLEHASADESPLRYTLLVFRATALRNTGDADAAARVYAAAAEEQPELPLAWQGLAALHAAAPANATAPLERLAAIYAATGSAEKLKDARLRLCAAYEQAERHSDAAAVVQQMLDAEPGSPELLRRLVDLTQRAEEGLIAAEVQTRRHRLGAPPLEELQDIVRTEVVRASDLDAVIRALSEVAADDERADMLDRLVDRLRRKVPAVPPSMRDAATRELLRIARECGSARSLCVVADLTDVPMDEATAECALHAAVRAARGDNPLPAIAQARELAASLSRDYGVRYPRLTRDLDRAEGIARSQGGDHADAIRLLAPMQEDGDVVPPLLASLRAAHRFDEAIALQAQHLNGWSARGDMAWDMCRAGRTAEALEAFAAAVGAHGAADIAPAFAVVLARYALLLWERAPSAAQDPSSPFGMAIAAAKADPALSAPFHVLGLFYARAGDAARAERCLAKALENEPDRIDAALALAQLLVARSRGTDAAAVLEPFARAPEHLRNLQLWRLCARASCIAHDWERAAGAWQAALRATAADDADGQRGCLLGMAESYRRTGRHVAAVKALHTLLARDPADAHAAAALAVVECDTGLYADADERVGGLLAAGDAALAPFLYLVRLRATTLRAGDELLHGCVQACEAHVQSTLRLADEALASEPAFAAQCVLRACCHLFVLQHLGRALLRETTGALEAVAAALRERLSADEDVLSVADDMIGAVPEPTALSTAALTAAMCVVQLAEGAPDAWADVARVLLFSTADARALSATALSCVEQTQPDSAAASPDVLLVAAAVHAAAQKHDLAQHYALRAIEALPAASIVDAALCAESAPRLCAAWTILATVYAELGALDLAAEAAERAVVDAASHCGPAWFFSAWLQSRTGAAGALALEDRVDNAARVAPASFAPAHAVYGLGDAPRADAETRSRVRLSLLCAAQFVGDAERLRLAYVRADADPAPGVEEAVHALERDADGFHCEAAWLRLARACSDPPALPAESRTLLLDWLAARVNRDVAAELRSPAIAASIVDAWDGVYASMADARAAEDGDDMGPGAKQMPDEVRRALTRTAAFFADAAPFYAPRPQDPAAT